MRVKYPLEDLEEKTSLIKEFCLGQVSVFDLVYVGILVCAPLSSINEIKTRNGKISTGSINRELKAPYGDSLYIQIGLDFSVKYLSNDLYYLRAEIKNLHASVTKICRQYIIDNKEEFPDMYLDLML